MNRRNFIKNICMLSIAGLAIPSAGLLAQEEYLQKTTKKKNIFSTAIQPIDYLHKMENFDETFVDDYILPTNQHQTLYDITQKLTRIENTVGHANFMIIDYTSAINIAKNYPKIGAFTPKEYALIHQLFEETPKQYGFLGERTVSKITYSIPKNSIIKIPYTGNYLFRGEPLRKWQRIQHIMNNKILLTSGVRNIIKQMHLFCKKTLVGDYNLSLASRSIAPAGFSFHTIGDFDVGKPGYGMRNFTKDFLHTRTYAILVDAGVLDLRYYEKNTLGVRFEPWHVKV